jgi:hypothetical protein
MLDKSKIFFYLERFILLEVGLGFISKYQERYGPPKRIKTTQRLELAAEIQKLPRSERCAAARAVQVILSRPDVPPGRWPELTTFFWDHTGQIKPPVSALFSLLTTPQEGD